VLASDELEKEGISVEVINPRTLVPLDKETILSSVKKTGRVLIVHEACERAGSHLFYIFQIFTTLFPFFRLEKHIFCLRKYF